MSPLDRLKRVLDYVAAWREANPVYMPFPPGTPTLAAKQLAESARQADIENRRLLQQLAETRRHNLATEALEKQQADQPSSLDVLLGLSAGLFNGGGSDKGSTLPTPVPQKDGALGSPQQTSQPTPSVTQWRPILGSGAIIQPVLPDAEITLPENLRVKQGR